MLTRPAVLQGTPLLDAEVGIVRPSIGDYTDSELLSEIRQVLLSNQVTNGLQVRRLEERMADYLQVQDIVAVSSCTLGLTLALQAAGITNTEVIVPSFTIAATVNALYWNRCKPVFADIDPETFNISPEHVEALITEETGAIMPVHVFGNPCPIDELLALGQRHSIPVVFDAAQAFGSTYGDAYVGRFGQFEVFSGSPTKHFTSAEGGFVATNDPDLAKMVRLTRNYGVLPSYDCVLPGLNARMPEINAVIGSRLLRDTDDFVAARNRYAGRYQELLAGVPGFQFQEVTPGAMSSYNYFGIVVDPVEFGLTNRELGEALKADRIGTKVYYHPPVHQQQAFRMDASLPETERISEQIICLPMYNSMEPGLIEGISEAIHRIHGHAPGVRAALAGHAVHA